MPRDVTAELVDEVIGRFAMDPGTPLMPEDEMPADVLDALQQKLWDVSAQMLPLHHRCEHVESEVKCALIAGLGLGMAIERARTVPDA